VTCYFDKVWNTFVQQKDGSIQWIPEQIVGNGEDFHSQVKVFKESHEKNVDRLDVDRRMLRD
jgi:hypothetical protein